MQTIRLRTPVDPITVAVVREIDAVLDDRDTPFMLLGATARDILLQNVHGISPLRATRDIDFAIALPDWAAYETLHQALLSTKRFRASQQRQRLIYQATRATPGLSIDLIPFGEIEHEPATIAWPPDMAVMLNVSGFREVLEAALSVELDRGLPVSIASLAGIALLKVLAWSDRGASNPKDATDLAELLERYADAGNLDRVYDEVPKILERLDYDVQLTGMWMLGQDIARMASADTRAKLLGVLRDERRLAALANDMIRGKHYHDEAFSQTGRRLQIFRDGIESQWPEAAA